MTPDPNRPFYEFAPVRDLETLAEALELSRPRLEHLSRNADRMYTRVMKKKKDGSPRETWNAHRQLKRIQELIKVRFLTKVKYPLYLQGGIRDPEHPRDYARNAGIHAGRACVINEDISDFFPSTTADQVREIWENVFRFSPEAANCLTKLTTRRRQLPQGAKTSNHLANLAQWRDEYEIVRHLTVRGFRYSRLTDDLTVSSSHPLSTAVKTWVVSTVYAFLHRHGYRPKRKKHFIYNRGKPMLVNGLVVNRYPALPKRERSAIRSLVHHTIDALHSEQPAETELSLRRVIGKVGKLKRFHPRLGQRLGDRLKVSMRR